MTWFLILTAVLSGAVCSSRRFPSVIRLCAGAWLIAILAIVASSPRGAIKARDVARAVTVSAPACIQIPDGAGGYRPATSLIDLSPVAMRSHDGRYHAVLVVETPGGRGLYNWSYRRTSWTPVPHAMETMLTLRCAPRSGYLDRLGWLTAAASVGQPKDLYRLGDAAFLIPASFRPTTQNGTYLSLDAPAPEFDPDASGMAGFDNRSVSLSFGSRDWLEGVAGDSRAAVDLTRDSPTAEDRPRSYVERDSKGRALTFIDCPVAQSARRPAPCQHRFYSAGAMWTFRQSMDDLPRWRELQVRVKQRISAFAAAAARCEADAAAC